ncbi:glycine/D-amino acid oxidase [Bacillus freudenreichii]|nr:glycine/D-amino acid oxidase [Bacillus freudenreichii]
MKVIVVGSGIVGASAAYHLAKKGAEVVVMDQGHEGQATPAGAGIVCPWISREKEDHPDRYAVAKAGACYYPKLIAMLEQDGVTDTGYSLVGALAISDKDEVLAEIEEKVKSRKAETPEVGEVRRLTAEEAQAHFPPLKEGIAAVYVSGAARVDGASLRDSLKRGAEKHGAQFYSGEASLEVAEGRVLGIRTSDKFIASDSVVVAGGAWASRLFEPLGIDIAIEPERGQIAHLVLSGEDTGNWPIIHPMEGHYLVPFEGSRVVAGATREAGTGFDYRMTAGGVKEVLDEALAVAPGLKDSTLKEVRVGFRPVCPDNLPSIGAIQSVEGLVVANGLGSLGLTMGPYAGAVAARLALGEEVGLDLSPYDPLRHAGKKVEN